MVPSKSAEKKFRHIADILFDGFVQSLFVDAKQTGFRVAFVRHGADADLRPVGEQVVDDVVFVGAPHETVGAFGRQVLEPGGHELNAVVAGKGGAHLPGELGLKLEQARAVVYLGAADFFVRVDLGQLFDLAAQGVDRIHHGLDVFFQRLFVVGYGQTGFTGAFKGDVQALDHFRQVVGLGGQYLGPAVHGEFGVGGLLAVPVVAVVAQFIHAVGVDIGQRHFLFAVRALLEIVNFIA